MMATLTPASRALASLLLSLCCAAGAQAATPQEVEAGNNEATFRLIAVHCASKSEAREFIASSKRFVRNSFANHAQVEQLAQGRPAGADDIATASPAQCADWNAQVRELMAARAQAEATLGQLMKKFVK